jgi:AcrR family transcriptional regulator
VNPETCASLRQKILEEALALISREGVAGVTMRALAQQLGYSPATIYLYFRNKEDLFQEIARVAADRIRDLTDRCQQIEDAAAARDAFARAFIEFGLTQPHLYRVLMTLDLAPFRGERAEQTPGRDLVDRYRDIYRRGASAGQLRSMNPEFDVLVDLSLVHGFLSRVDSGGLPLPRMAGMKVEELADVILAAIRTRTAVSSAGA